MPNRQTGVTMIGWLIIIAIIGIFAMAAMRLVPVYAESMEVRSVLTSLKQEHDGNLPTMAAIRKGLSTRFQVKDIVSIKAKDVKVTQIGDGTYQVHAEYKRTSPFIGNLGLTVSVDHKVEIRR